MFLRYAVAPCTGAWIETPHNWQFNHMRIVGRSLHRSVD